MSELNKYIGQEISGTYPPEIDMLVRLIMQRAENSQGIVAILLYGSGLWNKDPANIPEGVVWDLHVLVDEYSDFDDSVFLSIAGNLLPHNVYYLENRFKESGKILRSKYNVMKLEQFDKHAKGQCITPQIWARFCQPCRLVYARDEQAKKAVINALSDCVKTFLSKALQLIEDTKCRWQDIWIEGFRQTYQDEWRSESADRSAQIIASSEDAFRKRTSHALHDKTMQSYFIDDDHVRIGYGSDHVKSQQSMRKLSRPLKKFVALMRLIKATFTFENSMEYAAWKIERHSGYKVNLTEFQKKHPVIGGAPLLFSLWRKGVLK